MVVGRSVAWRYEGSSSIYNISGPSSENPMLLGTTYAAAVAEAVCVGVYAMFASKVKCHQETLFPLLLLLLLLLLWLACHG
jgi:hypothetical protein